MNFTQKLVSEGSLFTALHLEYFRFFLPERLQGGPLSATDPPQLSVLPAVKSACPVAVPVDPSGIVSSLVAEPAREQVAVTSMVSPRFGHERIHIGKSVRCRLAGIAVVVHSLPVDVHFHIFDVMRSGIESCMSNCDREVMGCTIKGN